MNYNDCYIVLSNDKYLTFPSLDCSDGDFLQLSAPTLAYEYEKVNGRVISTRAYMVNPTDYDSYLTHNWGDNSSDLIFSPEVLLLCGLLIVGVFFSVIWRWFIRLRG